MERDGLDPVLRERLEAVGLDPDDPGDPAAAWRRLRERFGRRITLLERYGLEAQARGAGPEELDAETRARLGGEVMRAQWPGFAVTETAFEGMHPVQVVPADPRWAGAFADWRTRLAGALGSAATRIEHVGSTSVPGLAAKPILDVQISVPDIEEEPAYVPAIETTGLRLRARDQLHRFFRHPAGQARTVHVHVCSSGSEWEREHLLFRDYLRAVPAAAEAYAELKRDLARRYRDDRLAYTDAKTGFILDTADEAGVWAARTGWTVGGRST